MGEAVLPVTKAESDVFGAKGFLLQSSVYDPKSLDAMIADIQSESDAVSVPEEDGITARSVHFDFARSRVAVKLASDIRLVKAVETLLQDRVYAYQIKVNLKPSFEGKAWPWHQDFSFWREQDGMMAPKVLTAAIFLDDVSNINGPMFFIPGSQKFDEERLFNDHSPENWEACVSADLPYQTQPETVKRLARENGIVAPIGPRGSVLFFHGNIIHGSAANISPFPRRIAFVTYNAVTNAVRSTKRPTFLVNPYRDDPL